MLGCITDVDSLIWRKLQSYRNPRLVTHGPDGKDGPKEQNVSIRFTKCDCLRTGNVQYDRSHNEEGDISSKEVDYLDYSRAVVQQLGRINTKMSSY